MSHIHADPSTDAPGPRAIHLYKAWVDQRLLALIATEQDGRLLHVRRMHAR